MEKKPFWGFRELWDFSRPQTVKEKLENILLAYVLTLLWVMWIRYFQIALGIGVVQVPDFFTKSVMWSLTKLSQGPFMNFCDKVLWAPFSETIMFVWGAYRLMLAVESIPGYARKPWYLPLKIPVVICSSMWFGWAHGPPAALHMPLQGIYGLIWSWLYFKNKNSFWSVVVVHALWNFMLLMGLQFVIH